MRNGKTSIVLVVLVILQLKSNNNCCTRFNVKIDTVCFYCTLLSVTHNALPIMVEIHKNRLT